MSKDTYIKQISETVTNIVSVSKELNPMQKNHFRGMLNNAVADRLKNDEANDIINSVDKSVKVSEIVLHTDEVIIYKTYDKDYPFGGVFYKDEKWNRLSNISDTFDKLILVYLSIKYSGRSESTYYVAKLLDMPMD